VNRTQENLYGSLALAAALALPAVVFACGSSDSPAAPTDAGTDAADATPADPIDAGPDAEQPEDIYPAQHAPIPQLDDQGGPVLDHMKLVTITFFHAAPGDAGAADAAADGGDAGDGRISDEWKDLLRGFDDFIVGSQSQWWSATMAGYKVGPGTGGLYAELDDTPVAGKSITDEAIQKLLADGIAAGTIPAPQDQILYAFYFPASTQISNFNASACTDFLGYHYEMSVTVGGVAKQVSYAVMPRCPAATKQATKDQLTVTASHELAEAASDPFPTSNGTYRLLTNDAWIPLLGGGTAGDENGDVCIFAPNYDESGYKVQPIWSNGAAAASKEPCQPQPPLASPIYYGAAVRTPKIKDQGRQVSGYVVVPVGGSVTVSADFFSTAKLPHDVRLFVGRDKGTGDPTDMRDIANGITAALSRTDAHNGNALSLTLTAPANAVRGDYHFVVRSVLEPTDFHDWPVIARVQ
jgi:hypothetical protein